MKKSVLIHRLVLVFAVLSSFTPGVYPETPLPAPRLTAPSFLLADASSGTILLEQNIDLRMPPASLAKLMTLHLSITDVKEGVLSASELRPVPANGSALSMRPGSSVIGLQKGDTVSTGFLQTAAAAVSANDAAWSLAILSSDSTAQFVQRMNTEAARLGMTQTRYTDPDGWSSQSFTTAADQLVLAKRYITLHPRALEDFHSRMRVDYRPSGSSNDRVEKTNTNLLLGDYPGADGLKTGTIAPDNFHFIATAMRNSTRFIAIVMGISSSNYTEGLRVRAAEARELLDYGFANWTSFRPPSAQPRQIQVRHGKDLTAWAVPVSPIPFFTVKHNETDTMTAVLDLDAIVEAPMDKGTVVGEIRWYAGSRLLGSSDYQLSNKIERRWRLRHLFKQ